jgi:hypothetical protein
MNRVILLLALLLAAFTVLSATKATVHEFILNPIQLKRKKRDLTPFGVISTPPRMGVIENKGGVECYSEKLC